MERARHLDRTRAESFGALADEYDRYRPAHPPELVDDLVALAPATVLDIGCGTGKLAVLLVERALDVLGVEVDERMAAVARAHGIDVEVASFEDWDDAGRRFDLVTCANAWHWIDPERGGAKAAQVLNPGGTLARVWTIQMIESDAIAAAVEDVYAEHAPAINGYGTLRRHEGRTWAEDHPGFEPSGRRRYDWDAALAVDDWIALIGTFSDHQALPPQRLASLQDGLREVLPDPVQIRGETRAQLARRVTS